MTEEKTKEQLFAENPDRFEDLENILFAVKRNEEGRLIVLTKQMSTDDLCRVRCITADTLREYSMLQRIEKAKQNGAGIIKPGENGFKQGLRNFLNKR